MSNKNQTPVPCRRPSKRKEEYFNYHLYYYNSPLVIPTPPLLNSDLCGFCKTMEFSTTLARSDEGSCAYMQCFICFYL